MGIGRLLRREKIEEGEGLCCGVSLVAVTGRGKGVRASSVGMVTSIEVSKEGEIVD